MLLALATSLQPWALLASFGTGHDTTRRRTLIAHITLAVAPFAGAVLPAQTTIQTIQKKRRQRYKKSILASCLIQVSRSSPHSSLPGPSAPPRSSDIVVELHERSFIVHPPRQPNLPPTSMLPNSHQLFERRARLVQLLQLDLLLDAG